MKDIDKLKTEVIKFRNERDWKQFHTPKDLVQAISIESSELAELFLWVSQEDSYDTAENKKEQVAEEMADIFIYLLSLSDVINIDLAKAVENKLQKNSIKYPTDKVKGKIVKYSDL